MDAHLTIPKPANLSFAQASATGVGILTAAIGVSQDLKVPLEEILKSPAPKDEWALVFGGAGSVGQFVVQLLKLSGFKVLTTCSPKSTEVRSFGAFLTFLLI